jgi:hypothetical protein
MPAAFVEALIAQFLKMLLVTTSSEPSHQTADGQAMATNAGYTSGFHVTCAGLESNAVILNAVMCVYWTVTYEAWPMSKPSVL